MELQSRYVIAFCERQRAVKSLLVSQVPLRFVSTSVVGPIAQSVEQRTFNPWVDGSSPSGPTSVNEIRVSGSVDNHFAPEAKLVLDISPQPGDGIFALAATETPTGVIRLEAPLIHKEFAGILHLSLRSASLQKLARAVVN
jgi:hypothetical protein